MKTNIFDRLSFWSLFLVIVLLPFFFLPGTFIPIEISKGALLVIGLVFSLIFWGFARFFDGKIILPKSFALAAGGGVVLVFFLSAIFSKSSQMSFFGTMFDVGAFWFVFSGFLLMLLSAIAFRDPKKARMLLLGAILSSAILLVFQSLHLFMPKILSLGVLGTQTDNLLGSWNALGIFAGFSGLMSLLVVEFFSTTKIEKWLLRTLVVLSIILIAIVNFPLVWGIFGVFALIIFVYKISITSKEKISENSESAKKSFPVFSFAVIMVALLFFMSGQFIRENLPFGISSRLQAIETSKPNEVSPSFLATMGITKQVIKNNSVLGIGPNKFSNAWALYKPQNINDTIFWDVPFSSGSGLLPTLTATTGVLGLISWLLFFVLFLISGVRSVFFSIKSGVNWEMMAFFSLSVYLFISAVVYSTGPVIFLLALAFAGVFLGLSFSHAKNKEISFSFLNDHRKSFFSMMFIVILIIASVAISFKYVERLASISYFRKAISAQTVPEAEASISKALTLHTNDLYLRAYGDIYFLKLNSIFAKGESLSDADKALLQATLDKAVAGVNQAASHDSENYLNFQALGSLYQNVASFGVKDAYGRAVEAYNRASLLNPTNPRLKLSMAIASFADKKVDLAKDYANSSLLLKPNYIDALIFLSQVAVKEGDKASALSYAEEALSFSPANADLIKYVDSLKSPVSAPAKDKDEDKATKKP